MLKCATSLRGSFHAIALAGHAVLFEETSQRWQAVGNTEFDLSGQRFESQTSRSRDLRKLPLSN